MACADRALTQAYIGIGGNLGDVAQTLHDAVAMLDAHGGIEVKAVSSAYRTAPWGETDQPDYLNAVASLMTSLTAAELHQVMQKVERHFGRRRENELRWGPRTLDLDLLLFGTERIMTEHLTVPHPRMAERSFVMVPLLELNPGIGVPGHGEPAANRANYSLDGIRRVGKVYPNVELFSGN